MNKCDFCDRSVLKEGKLTCSIEGKSDVYRSIYCGNALDDYKEFIKSINGKEEKES